MKNLFRIIFIVSVAFLLFKLISRISITNLDNQDLTQYVDTRIGSKAVRFIFQLLNLQAQNMLDMLGETFQREPFIIA
jgi:hypothetical protein